MAQIEKAQPNRLTPSSPTTPAEYAVLKSPPLMATSNSPTCGQANSPRQRDWNIHLWPNCWRILFGDGHWT